MILIGGLWGWVAMFLRMYLFEFIMETVGIQKFQAWSESWGTLRFHTREHGTTLVHVLPFTIDYVLLTILMIPLYMLWSFARTERRDKYLAAIGGKPFDETTKI